jgi:hypothetical protein
MADTVCTDVCMGVHFTQRLRAFVASHHPSVTLGAFALFVFFALVSVAIGADARFRFDALTGTARSRYRIASLSAVFS